MSEGPRHRILVVEDDPEIQYLLSMILDASDREIVAVGSGGEAQSVLDEGGIELGQQIIENIDAGAALLTVGQGEDALNKALGQKSPELVQGGTA